MTLDEIISLDKAQKGKRLTSEEVKHLKNKGLVEGIKPNYFISVGLARTTGQKAEYTKAKGLERNKHFELIQNLLKKYDYAERKDIDALLWDTLPAWMNDKQKKNKIN